MSADFIQGSYDGTGKKVARDSITEAAGVVHRQRILIDASAAVTGPLRSSPPRLSLILRSYVLAAVGVEVSRV